MPAVRQTNFLGGEVAPALWGRTDLGLHAHGLRTCLNFFPSHHGMAVSRPGTLYCDDAKFQAEDRTQYEMVRLVPFSYADDSGALLVFGERYLRAYLLNADGSFILPYQEFVSPYSAVDLRELQWAQMGTMLVLTCPGYPPQQVSVTGTTFALAEWTTTRPETRFVRVENQNDATGYPMLVSPAPAGTLFVGDADHRPVEWEWRVTATLQDANGGLSESAAWPVTRFYDETTAGAFVMPTGNAVVLYPDRPVTLRRYTTSPGATYGGEYVVKAYNFYRGRGGIHGYVGSTAGMDFVDDGREPDFDFQPPTGQTPFLAKVGEQDRPNSIVFGEGRLIFGGTTFRPETLLMSAVGDIIGFDLPKASLSKDQALSLTLLGRRQERIRSLLSTRRLLVFTDSSVWVFGAEPLTLETMASARVEDDVGATALQPLLVSGAALWVRSKGRGVRALAPDSAGGLTGIDVSWHAQHLFQGGETTDSYGAAVTRQVVDWAYQEDPWGLVWAVRADGWLLSCTFGPDGHKAWARHWLSGQCLAVASVPRPGEDVVYVAVKRGEHVTLERLASRVRNDNGYDDVCTDGSKRHVIAMDEGITTLLADLQLPHLPDTDNLWVTAAGNAPVGPLRLVDGVIRWGATTPSTDGVDEVFESNLTGLDGVQYVVVTAGVGYHADLETLDVAGGEARTRQKTVRQVGFEVDNSKGLLVGQDAEHLTEWRQRKVTDSWLTPSMASELVVAPVSGTWDKGGRAYLRQALPLPVTVLGITREVELGGS